MIVAMRSEMSLACFLLCACPDSTPARTENSGPLSSASDAAGPREACMNLAALADKRSSRDEPRTSDVALLEKCSASLAKLPPHLAAMYERCLASAKRQDDLVNCPPVLPRPGEQEPYRELRQLWSAMVRYALGNDADGQPRYRCFDVASALGPTPPQTVHCGALDGRPCRPVRVPSGPGEYHLSEWTKGPGWATIGFMPLADHQYRYGLRWSNFDRPEGGCMFTAQAFGNLDDDGTWSTYELSGAVDGLGPVSPGGFYVEKEGE